MDKDEYTQKIAKEIENYSKNINVHDLPEIFHYWSNKYLNPIFLDAKIKSIEDFFVSNLQEASKSCSVNKPIFLSVGSGNCDLEIGIVKRFLELGFKNFEFECLELNEDMLARAIASSNQYGLQNYIKFSKQDFNSWAGEKGRYVGIMANQSLHHVWNLEGLYLQIHESLNEDGSFVISDMIGRNGHMRWPKALDIVNAYWMFMPDKYKYNRLLNRLENLYENWDCSKEGFEGIRAQEVLPLLFKQDFRCELFVGFGNLIDIFIDRCFGHNFDINLVEDLAFIDMVHLRDELELVNRNISPCHMLGVFTKKNHKLPFYSRGINPLEIVFK